MKQIQWWSIYNKYTRKPLCLQLTTTMSPESELYLDWAVTVFSLVLSIVTTFIAIFFVSNFIKSRDEDDTKVMKYFKISASIVVIFNALCCLFNSVYCSYLIFDPEYDDTVFYVWHPSHYQRITSTASWYVAKVSLIWFLSGRVSAYLETIYFCVYQCHPYWLINKNYHIFYIYIYL